MSTIRQALAEDHAHLEKQLQALANAVCADDSCTDLRRVWASFEDDLLEHLSMEERSAFPPVASHHRAEIEALRAEHREIRRRVAELGVCVELHTLREGAVSDLIKLLRAHASREDRTLYTWLSETDGASWRALHAMSERHRRGNGTDTKSQAAPVAASK